jgi:aryl-alcohol dehydrogenase-like predicted oxidoreductase
VAKKEQRSPNQVALAWLLQRSPIMLPIPGTSSIEHLEENIAAGSFHLTKEEFAELSGVAEVAA